MRSCFIAFIGVTVGACADNAAHEPQVAAGDARAGRAALEAFECGVCHVIPGVRGARGQVGPPLDALRRQVYVAGKFPNTPQMLQRWIRNAPALAAGTAMPDVGVGDRAARDMAAYLYSLE